MREMAAGGQEVQGTPTAESGSEARQQRTWDPVASNAQEEDDRWANAEALADELRGHVSNLVSKVTALSESVDELRNSVSELPKKEGADASQIKFAQGLNLLLIVGLVLLFLFFVGKLFRLGFVAIQGFQNGSVGSALRCYLLEGSLGTATHVQPSPLVKDFQKLDRQLGEISRSLIALEDRLRSVEIGTERFPRHLEDFSEQISDFRRSVEALIKPEPRRRDATDREERRKSAPKAEADPSNRLGNDVVDGLAKRPPERDWTFKRDQLCTDYNQLLSAEADIKEFVQNWKPQPVALSNFDQRAREPGYTPHLALHGEAVGQAGEHFWLVSPDADNKGFLLPAFRLFLRETALIGETAAPFFESIYERQVKGTFSVLRPAEVNVNVSGLAVVRIGLLTTP